MDARILHFISALRASGVQISIAESIDACKAVEVLGVNSRERFRSALLATTVKNANHVRIFEELFPLFFEIQHSPPTIKPLDGLSEREIELLFQALQDIEEELRKIIHRLLHGEVLSTEELENLSKRVGLHHSTDLRQRSWMAGRMSKSLRLESVQVAIETFLSNLHTAGLRGPRVTQITDGLRRNMRALQDQIRNYSGQQIAERLSQDPTTPNLDDLLERPFHKLTEVEMAIIRKEVRRLAARLRTKVTLRQKRAKTGKLDPKSTLRSNLKHGNVPFKLKYRSRHYKPKLVVLCDISTSMRYISELMLSLVFSLQDQIRKTHAFAFIDHLEYISPDFSGRDAHSAVKRVLKRLPSGYYSTDLGNSLSNFTSDFSHTLDNQTTLIIVGDARNNFNNPRLDIFYEMATRSRLTIWLNPEPRSAWDSGDSDMHRYEEFCDHVFKVSNLAELTKSIDSMLIYGG